MNLLNLLYIPYVQFSNGKWFVRSKRMGKGMTSRRRPAHYNMRRDSDDTAETLLILLILNVMYILL